MKLCGHCKNRGKKRICDFYTVISNYAEKCKDFEEKKQTNADRIRSFSDEELAEFLIHVETLGYNDSSVSGKLEMIEWLQSEVEE